MRDAAPRLAGPTVCNTAVLSDDHDPRSALRLSADGCEARPPSYLLAEPRHTCLRHTSRAADPRSPIACPASARRPAGALALCAAGASGGATAGRYGKLASARRPPEITGRFAGRRSISPLFRQLARRHATPTALLDLSTAVGRPAEPRPAATSRPRTAVGSRRRTRNTPFRVLLATVAVTVFAPIGDRVLLPA